MDLKKTIGRRLQSVRLRKNLTQEQVGDKLNLSTSAYCKIEYGETDLTLKRLNQLAEILGMSPLELFQVLQGDSTDIDLEESNNDKNNRQDLALINAIIDVNKEIMEQLKKVEILTKRIDALEGR